jgi:hypothetical protein
MLKTTSQSPIKKPKIRNMDAKELYQCPYERACKCDLKDCCLECETFGEYLNGNTILPQSKLAEMPSDFNKDDFRENIANELSRDELIDRICDIREQYELIKQHLTESKQEEGEVISDKEIETYVKGKYGKSALKPEIIARRAIQDYRNGLPPFSKDKAVLDKPEGEEKKEKNRKSFYKILIEHTKDIDPDIQAFVDANFWDLF